MLAAFSPGYGVLVGARVIIGLAVGSASMVVPLYIGEVAPPRVRGALDRTGRRPLLLGGTTGMAAGMIVVALTFGIGGSQLHGGAAYIAIAGLLLYTGSFAIGLGPVFWLLISEIYPVKIRGQAMSVATMANWGANFVVTISFLTLLSAIGNAGTFFLFTGLSIVALAYFQ